MKTIDENVYRKLPNGRYKAFGVLAYPDHMGDGIWYVRHHDYSNHITNVKYLEGLFRVGSAETPDLPKLCGMEDYIDYIFQSDEYNQLINRKEGYSINDLLHTALAKAFEFNEKKNVDSKR